MDIWKKHKSPLGYETNNGGIDSYGVDHSGFSVRDEVEYQTARNNRENQIIDYYNNQGITENYPQYTTNFWGSPDNNYGFGSSNITDAISAHPAMNTSPIPITPTQSELNDYQRGVNRFEQANAAGSFMSGIGNGFNGSHIPAWGSSYGNHLNNQQNYAITSNIDNISAASLPQADVLGQQRRAVENDLLMNGMDVLYGMNRTINGMTFGGLDRLGNKLGIDTQMNEYLNLKGSQSRNLARRAGQIVGYSGSALTGGALANASYNQANIAYNGYKIGKAYDKLSADPFQGNGSDIIARMKNHNGEPVIFQRGEAIRGPNGEVVTSGRVLQRETGTERNYGLDKIIYKHEMPRNEVTRIPQYLKQYQPTEISPRGQGVYAIRQPNGEIRLITTPRGNYSTVSSMYIKNK